MIADLLKRILNETQEPIHFHDTKSAIIPSNPRQQCWLQRARLDEGGAAVIDYSIVGQRGVFTQKADSLRLDDIGPLIECSALLVLEKDE